jgi:CTP:molybdopterin cytidylyltransferase MocA
VSFYAGGMTRADGGAILVVLAAGRARRYGGCKPLAPVDPIEGNAVIDLLASDAVSAGFGTIVLVVGPATGPAIRYHVERTWPQNLDVRFELQERPLGTVHALLCGTAHVADDRRVGVANADDLYGEHALALLAEHLAGDDPSEAVVAFRLRNAIVGDAPVTRGVCEVAADGSLVSITERRQVMPAEGGRFVSKDGSEPSELDGDALVSMNLWGFTPLMREVLARTMAEARGASEESEVLLPDAVGVQVRRGDGGPSFRVLKTDSRCIGVTHPDDLALVQAELAQAVAAGQRPARLWTGLRL